MNKAMSVDGTVIRLTDERWAHIVENHGELVGRLDDILGAISIPDFVLSGNRGECLAIQEYAPGKYIVAVYRESQDDGFVITAYITRNVRRLRSRKQIWP